MICCCNFPYHQENFLIADVDVRLQGFSHINELTKSSLLLQTIIVWMVYEDAYPLL